MYQDEVVLCGSSAYTKKFYLNGDFANLPEQVQNDLKILCVLYTEDIGGTLQLVFDREGSLVFRTEYAEDDFLYDEIGSVLKIKQLRQTKQELFEALEMFYRVFYLGGEFEED